MKTHTGADEAICEKDLSRRNQLQEVQQLSGGENADSWGGKKKHKSFFLPAKPGSVFVVTQSVVIL